MASNEDAFPCTVYDTRNISVRLAVALAAVTSDSHRARPIMFRTILIATDGSADGDRAFALARSMAVEAGSRLVVVYIAEIVPGKGGMYPLHVNEDQVRASIEALARKARADGVNSEAITETSRMGGPAHGIAEVARSVDADVIVVGTRGRTPVSEVVLGSVPIRLLQVAHRPVLIVPSPEVAGEKS